MPKLKDVGAVIAEGGMSIVAKVGSVRSNVIHDGAILLDSMAIAIICVVRLVDENSFGLFTLFARVAWELLPPMVGR